MRKGSPESYTACPYCLTEITAADAQIVANNKDGETEHLLSKEEADNFRAPPECKTHFGYLGERSTKEQIPDECMMCKALFQCMLKKGHE